MTNSLNRLTLAMLLGFVAVAVSLTYWGVFASDNMYARQDNPRLVENERAIQRGRIYDRNGQILVETVQTGMSPSNKPLWGRSYPSLEAVSVVGYYSLNYGVGGAEAAFDKILRGDDALDTAQISTNQMLHRVQTGSDVRLTIDLDLQKAIVQVFGGRKGAAVVIDVPSGAVLAMVSLPTFDPALLNIPDQDLLEATYKKLSTDPGAPLINRVTGGIYQPGGALQTVILAAMLTRKLELNAPVINAEDPVKIDGLTLTCGAPNPAVMIKSAYALSCPSIFANALNNEPGSAAVQQMIEAFGLLNAPTLVSFHTVTGPPPTPLPNITDPARLLAAGAGQSDLTVTPLQMALVVATIANGGSTITPYLADAIRRPGMTDWQTMAIPKVQSAVLTQDVAEAMRTAMGFAVSVGAAKAAQQPGLPIYGHASIAYTGPQKKADSWFLGFVDRPDGHAVTVAIVVEDIADPAVAAAIGGKTLVAAK